MKTLYLDDPDVVAFLEELTELTKKYRVAIAGCGCCGSPYLTSVDEVHEGCVYEVSPECQSDGSGPEALNWSIKGI